MAKSKRKTKKNVARPSKEEGQQTAFTDNKEQSTEAENQFDFGGIPARDLKKNLGCG